MAVTKVVFAAILTVLPVALAVGSVPAHVDSAKAATGNIKHQILTKLVGTLENFMFATDTPYLI